MPLSQYLDDLYPLARVLVGEVQADALVAETYRRALDAPEAQRPQSDADPDALRAWLVHLLLEARSDAGEATTDDASSDGADEASGGERRASASETASGTGLDDAFRRDVARLTAERVVPVAFAACSVQERLVLTLDVLSDVSDAALASILDTDASDARRQRREAHAALRAALRDSLTGPERMLVDVALPDAVLDETLHRFLTGHLRPAPAALRTRVAALLRDARETAPGDASQTAASDAASSSEEPGEPEAAPSKDSASDAAPQPAPAARGPQSPQSTPWWDVSSWNATLRRVVASAFVLLLIGGGAYALSVVLAPTPEPDPSLLSLTARRADAVRPLLKTNDPDEAAAYLSTEMGWSVVVPRIEGAALDAVSRLEVVPGADVPVLLFADTTRGTRLTAFVYTYALLDRLNDRAALDVPIRRRLADEQTVVVRRARDRTVLLWRRRDLVFVGVTPTPNAESLPERIR